MTPRGPSLNHRARRLGPIAAALLLASASLTGCARVKPHQRGRLAKPDMELTGEADLEAGAEHTLEYREGSAGGFGGGGGGCGCN